MVDDRDSATEWRQDVAMGVSPWYGIPILRLSPGGATQNHGRRIHVAPLGLRLFGDADHGLTPVATTYRPVGTKSHRSMQRLVAELNSQFAESAKLEQAIRANLRGLGYGE